MLGVEQGFFRADFTAVIVSCLGWSRDPWANFTAVRISCLGGGGLLGAVFTAVSTSSRGNLLQIWQWGEGRSKEIVIQCICIPNL